HRDPRRWVRRGQALKPRGRARRDGRFWNRLRGRQHADQCHSERNQRPARPLPACNHVFRHAKLFESERKSGLMKNTEAKAPTIQVLERMFSLLDVLASYQDPVSLKTI